MVKWTKQMLWYTKTNYTLVKGLKVGAKRCLNWISFHDDLCCCVEYSNAKIKLRFSILIIKSDGQKEMVEFGFRCRFRDLNYFEVGIFFHIPRIHYLLEGIITKLCGKPITKCGLSYFVQILDSHLFNNITYLHTTCTVF